MTNQEAWTCDACYEIKHYPLESRFQLVIFEYPKEDSDLEYDLCSKHYHMLMEILKHLGDEEKDKLIEELLNKLSGEDEK